jgi:geranylgeranyl transferase type-2 subunit beta
MIRIQCCAVLALLATLVPPVSAQDPQAVLDGLREFYRRTARPDGSFQPGIDPDYQGMSDSAYSDLAAVTYACTIHKTFGWRLPHEDKTIELLHSRQLASGDYVNKAGTVDPASPQGRTYNTTQALVSLRALGVKPRHDPLPVFEEILKQDYKTLPAYSTSFFPLAYLCAGKPIPEQADRAIRALMIQDGEGYLNDHVAATFHASHYYALVGEPTPKSEQMVARMLRDQQADGSWFMNLPSRDRHATFDAVFTLLHEGHGRDDCRAAIQRAAKWALSCRNEDGGFGHYPGSTSDADAVYFQVGTLVMAGFLKPADPLPPDPHLLSWGHLLPLRKRLPHEPVRIAMPGWVGGLALDGEGKTLATGTSDGVARLWDTSSGKALREFKGHTGVISSVAFSPDGAALASGSYDRTVRIWDPRSPQARHTLEGHAGAVLAVAWSVDGAWLATGSIDRTIRLWNAKSGKLHRTLTGHKSWVNGIAFLPDSEVIVSASSDGTVKMWLPSTGECLRTLKTTNAEVRSIAVSPDGEHIAAGIRYGEIKLYRADNPERASKSWKTAGPDDVWSLAFSADGRHLLAAAGEWNRPISVGLWNIESGQQTATLKHTGEPLAVAISADGKTAAIGGGDRSVSIYRLDGQAK